MKGVAERYLDTEEARVRVLERDGDPRSTVFFLHGLTSSATIWERPLSSLPEGIRGIAYDSLGGGYTEMKGERRPVTTGRQTELLLELARRFEVKDLYLVGHSMGCGPALRAGWTEPERVRAMLLIAPAALGRNGLSPTIRMARWRPTARLLEAASPLIAPRMARTQLRNRGQDPDDEEVMRRYAGHILDRPREIARGFVDIVGNGDVRRESVDVDRWKRITALTWILRGTKDEDWVPEEREARYRTLIPQARLIRWEGIGHSPQIEAPERFQVLLEQFLEASGVS